MSATSVVSFAGLVVFVHFVNNLFGFDLQEEDPDWFRKVQEEKAFPGNKKSEWWSNAHDEEISASSEQASPSLARV